MMRKVRSKSCSLEGRSGLSLDIFKWTIFQLHAFSFLLLFWRNWKLRWISNRHSRSIKRPRECKIEKDRREREREKERKKERKKEREPKVSLFCPDFHSKPTKLHVVQASSQCTLQEKFPTFGIKFSIILFSTITLGGNVQTSIYDTIFTNCTHHGRNQAVNTPPIY